MSHALVALAIPASSPVIPAKAGIQKAADIVGTRGGGCAVSIRIRIFRIGGIYRISLSPGFRFSP